MSHNPPLVVIVGPTASGKSDFAMQVARECKGELICADSRTVYKGMDIGTAKPSAEDRAAIPHHLLDVVRPDQPFTAADFKRLALEAIADIARRGNVPILVGGTGLYVDAVLFDYEFGEPANAERREALLQMSVEDLQSICRNNNIEIPVNNKNKRHLVRAIELGGLPKRNRDIRPHTLVVGISTDKQILRERVIIRAHAMLQAGITDEVNALTSRYGWESEAMTGNIYRVFRGFVQGSVSEEEAIEQVVRSDMSLIKRQLTWFKRNPDIIWGSPVALMPAIRQFLHL